MCINMSESKESFGKVLISKKHRNTIGVHMIGSYAGAIIRKVLQRFPD